MTHYRHAYTCDAPEGCSASVIGTLPKTWLLIKGDGHRCPEHVLWHCPGCNRLTRAQKFTVRQYPDTIKASGATGGLCVTCKRGREPVTDVPEHQVKYLRRLINDRFDDPDDALLVLDTLGLLGSDTQ